MLRDEPAGLAQVRGFEHKEPAQLLFRFGIGAIGDGHLAVFPSQSGGAPSVLEHFPTHKVTVLSKHAVVREALIHEGISLAFGYRFQVLLVKIPKADVFHSFLRVAVYKRNPISTLLSACCMG